MAAEAMTEERRARGIALCRWEAQRWRREAANVRKHAALPHLSPEARTTLLRSANRSDDEAAYWEAGVQDYEIQDTPQGQAEHQRAGTDNPESQAP